VPSTVKDSLWAEPKRRFEFPRGKEEIAKKNALGVMGKSFRGWKYVLNKSTCRDEGLHSMTMGRSTIPVA